VTLFPRACNFSFQLLFLPLLLCVTASAGRRNSGPSVAACPQVALTAQYLTEVTPGSGPGFHFVLNNHTSKSIKLAIPVPSSAHWFAQEKGRWLWRASNGAGGSLVNADSAKGQMFAYQPPASAADPTYMSVAARGSSEWDESVRENPVLLFKPGCHLCNHPDDRLYRVVFAYAYLPRLDERTDGLLRCGIRSNFVDVPPGRY
jgi:hypothetical protein